ncbi:MAG: hypothetical protein GWP19_00195 [Planctomycetia bacterium]|nr:hypothetical protein [Planctomycetia bacterium]
MNISERDTLVRIDVRQKEIKESIVGIEKHLREQNGRIGKAEIKIALIMGVGGSIVAILSVITMLMKII